MELVVYLDVDGHAYGRFRRNADGRWVDDDDDTLKRGLSDALDELEAQLEGEPGL